MPFVGDNGENRGLSDIDVPDNAIFTAANLLEPAFRGGVAHQGLQPIAIRTAEPVEIGRASERSAARMHALGRGSPSRNRFASGARR
jgi:hypothetical protein